MSIRQALRRQADLASRKRGKEPLGLLPSHLILAASAGVFVVVCVIEILHG